MNKEAFAVYMWQGNPNLHPLTCGRDSNHELSYDLIFKNGLYCPTCLWQQETVPQVVIDALMDVAYLVTQEQGTPVRWCTIHQSSASQFQDKCDLWEIALTMEAKEATNKECDIVRGRVHI